jgi:hypothetical protein
VANGGMLRLPLGVHLQRGKGWLGGWASGPGGRGSRLCLPRCLCSRAPAIQPALLLLLLPAAPLDSPPGRPTR